MSLYLILYFLLNVNATEKRSGICLKKYVGAGGGGGGGGGGFYKFFKKNFVAHETIDPNISWPSNFFRKYFMAPPINFSFLCKAYL